MLFAKTNQSLAERLSRYRSARGIALVCAFTPRQRMGKHLERVDLSLLRGSFEIPPSKGGALRSTFTIDEHEPVFE